MKKMKNKWGKLENFFLGKLEKKIKQENKKKQFEKNTGKKCGKPEKRTGNANPEKKAGKDVEDREENLGQDAPLPLHYICKMLLHVYHHVYLRK